MAQDQVDKVDPAELVDEMSSFGVPVCPQCGAMITDDGCLCDSTSVQELKDMSEEDRQAYIDGVRRGKIERAQSAPPIPEEMLQPGQSRKAAMAKEAMAALEESGETMEQAKQEQTEARPRDLPQDVPQEVPQEQSEQANEQQIFSAKQLLMELPDAPSQEQIDVWKERWGPVYVFPFDHRTVYVWRPLSRLEFHKLRESLSGITDEQQFHVKLQEYVVMRSVLWPKLEATSLSTARAGLVDTMFGVIMNGCWFFDANLAAQMVEEL